MTTTEYETLHKQAPVLKEGEAVFYVDMKLQSLIQFYFDNEVLTFNSCQDNVGGTCWIEYYLEDWIAITESAFRAESRELYDFIEEACEVLLLSVEDGELDEENDEWIEGENLIWSASVRFPKKYIADFERLVREALAPQEK